MTGLSMPMDIDPIPYLFGTGIIGAFIPAPISSHLQFEMSPTYNMLKASISIVK